MFLLFEFINKEIIFNDFPFSNNDAIKIYALKSK